MKTEIIYEQTIEISSKNWVFAFLITIILYYSLPDLGYVAFMYSKIYFSYTHNFYIFEYILFFIFYLLFVRTFIPESRLKTKLSKT